MWTNHEGEIFIEESEIFIEVYIIYFMLLMTHKKNHKLKKHKHKNNKKEKHTYNNMDGDFDKAFYYKQTQLK